MHSTSAGEGTPGPVSTGGRFARVLGSRGFLAAVLALAFLLRLGNVLALRGLPLFENLIVDSAAYDAWAQRIAAGDWMGSRVFFQDPLYPYLLALLYRWTGRDLLVVRLVQVAVGTGTCAFVAVIGRRVAGAVVGNLAALAVALYGPLLFQEADVEKTGLGVFLVAASLAFVLGRSTRSRLAAGAALGLAALTRGNLLAFLPLGATWLLSEPGGAAGQEGQWARWRERVVGPAGRAAGAFVLGGVLVLGPVAWRNHHVSGEWVLTTYQAGTNLYLGNNPWNQTGAFAFVPFVRADPNHLEEDFTAAAETRVGHRLTPREVSSYWAGQAWEHARTQPAAVAEVTLRKFLLFWANLELADGWDPSFLERFSPVLALPLLGLGALLPLAALGAIAYRRERNARMLAGFVLLYSASVLPFFVFARYRLHVVPALSVLSAMGATWAVARIRAGEWRLLAGPGIAAVLAAVLSLAIIRPDVPRENVSSFVSLSRMYTDAGKFDAAGAILGQGLAVFPAGRRAPLLCERSVLERRRGRVAAAVDDARQCLGDDPAHPSGWYVLGLAQEAAGDLTNADRSYERQTQLVPGHVQAEVRRALVAIRDRRPLDAVALLSGTIADRGPEPRLLLALAVAWDAAGRPEQSRAVLAYCEQRGWPSSAEALEQERRELLAPGGAR